MSWICPKCETENPDNLKVCEVCGDKSPHVEREELIKQATEEARIIYLDLYRHSFLRVIDYFVEVDKDLNKYSGWKYFFIAIYRYVLRYLFWAVLYVLFVIVIIFETRFIFFTLTDYFFDELPLPGWTVIFGVIGWPCTFFIMNKIWCIYARSKNRHLHKRVLKIMKVRYDDSIINEIKLPDYDVMDFLD